MAKRLHKNKAGLYNIWCTIVDEYMLERFVPLNFLLELYPEFKYRCFIDRVTGNSVKHIEKPFMCDLPESDKNQDIH